MQQIHCFQMQYCLILSKLSKKRSASTPILTSTTSKRLPDIFFFFTLFYNVQVNNNTFFNCHKHNILDIYMYSTVILKNFQILFPTIFVIFKTYIYINYKVPTYKIVAIDFQDFFKYSYI